MFFLVDYCTCFCPSLYIIITFIMMDFCRLILHNNPGSEWLLKVQQSDVQRYVSVTITALPAPHPPISRMCSSFTNEAVYNGDLNWFRAALISCLPVIDPACSRHLDYLLVSFLFWTIAPCLPVIDLPFSRLFRCAQFLTNWQSVQSGPEPAKAPGLQPHW